MPLRWAQELDWEAEALIEDKGRMPGIGVDGDSGYKFGAWYGEYVGFCTFLTQASASLVWGHEKTEFEDDQGWQWRHPDIVSAPLAIVEITQILIYIILYS